MALVELENVSKTYRNHVPVAALRDVSLRVEKGEFLAVVGPSGSGKTTLLNLIGALDRPDCGRIVVAGTDLVQASDAQRAEFRLHHLGFVFQAYNLFPVLTMMENLEFVLALQGTPKQQRRQKASELLKLAGLEGLAGRFPEELSGGQQQRVAVLRAILHEPDLVLADEPTANLDSNNARLLLELMRKLNQEKGTTFIFSTHDPLVMESARRIVRLKDGRVVEDVTVELVEDR